MASLCPQCSWSLPQRYGDKYCLNDMWGIYPFWRIISSLAEGTFLEPKGVVELVSFCHMSQLPLGLMRSVILPRLNSWGEKQQELQDEPGGDLFTLGRVITSRGLSYANAFNSKSTVII